MVEIGFPKCPICKKEVLLPFSVSRMESAKTFASWICTYCGFCITTGDSRGCNPHKDVTLGFISELVERTNKLREVFRKRYGEYGLDN